MLDNVAVNQHYVWRSYLAAWAVRGKVACCATRERRVFSSNPRNLGSERNFYRVADLSPRELEYLKAVADSATSDAERKINRMFVEMLTAPARLRTAAARLGIREDARTATEALLAKGERGIGELWHCAVEEKGAPLLERLRAGDASFWSDDRAAEDLCLFLGTQYLRTARMRNAMCQAIDLADINVERVWPVESHIWATRIGAALYRHRNRIVATVLPNQSQVPFITGDQPVINLALHTDPNIDFYYPVTPEFALRLTIGDKGRLVTTCNISAMRAETLNHAIFSWSDAYIYGADQTYLRNLAALPRLELL